MSLQTKNLSFRFDAKKKALLKSLNLTIPQFKKTAIMGLNGSGKTTLLRLLSGFLKPNHGQIIVNDKSYSQYSRVELAKTISVVPQDFPTVFPFTVFEFVMMGRFAWKNSFLDTQSDIDFVKTILKDLNLTEFEKRKITHLSGGERQRVLIARALAQNASYILLDEPFNHLDIKNHHFVLNLLNTLVQKQNKTIITVMHNLKAVEKHFDHVIFLNQGELIFEGTLKNALQKNHLEKTFEIPFDQF